MKSMMDASRISFLICILSLHNSAISLIHSFESNDQDEYLRIFVDDDTSWKIKRSADKDTIIIYDGSGDSTHEPCSVSTDMMHPNTVITSILPCSSLTSETTQVPLTTTTHDPILLIQQFVDILRSNSTDSTIKAQSLSSYITSMTTWSTQTPSHPILSPTEIDQIIAEISNVTLYLNTSKSFLMAQSPNTPGRNTTILGGSFSREQSGQLIDQNSRNRLSSSNLSVAIFFSNDTLIDVTSINILIIDRLEQYETLDQTYGQRVASSIVIVNLQKQNNTAVAVSLIFQILPEYRESLNSGSYVCSFYDHQTLKWNDTACSLPLYDLFNDRYECACNHLSTYALIWSPRVCRNLSETQGLNGTCIPRNVAQTEAVSIIRNTTNATVIATALSVYISAISNLANNTYNNQTATNGTSNTTDSNILTIEQIDHYLSNITNVSLAINTTDSILIAQNPNHPSGDILMGVSYTQDIGGALIYTNNQATINRSNFSVAAVLTNDSLVGVVSLNMLVIGNPIAFENIDNFSNKTLASSIVIVSVVRENATVTPLTIKLYFAVLDAYKPNVSADYFCSFFDTHTDRWNSSGCTLPTYNVDWDRYECKCNHLTSFALLWLPQSIIKDPISSNRLDTQDIASLVFQSISIVCFITTVLHAAINHHVSRTRRLRMYDLLPLLSMASTTLLFIFYIALAMTVYTQTPDTSQTKCSHNASALMFIVYFLLIFMFGIKTSVAYFNYLRFVVLFPEPSLRRLNLLLIISFVIAIIFVSFAASFNSNPSFHITQLYDAKLCWFTRDVLYYFLTIPVCVFLLLSVLSMVLVGRRIVNHVHQAGSSDHMYERMKRCVIVLLSSSVSQGLAWLLGPFLSVSNPEAGRVLGWFFVILIGLEGLWSILLYVCVRWQRIDESPRIKARRKTEMKQRLQLLKHGPNVLAEDIDPTNTDHHNLAQNLVYRDNERSQENLFDDWFETQSIGLSITDENEVRVFRC